ncbi:MAG: type II toxin-antitoxin system VapC family toxin [bacterium]
MSNKPLICVLDANVAIKLFFVQPLSDLADALFAHLEADARTRFYVPDFFYAECASAFVNYVRLMKYPPTEAEKDMAELHALGLTIIPTADLALQALSIAVHHRINGYDAFYPKFDSWFSRSCNSMLLLWLQKPNFITTSFFKKNEVIIFQWVAISICQTWVLCGFIRAGQGALDNC